VISNAASGHRASIIQSIPIQNSYKFPGIVMQIQRMAAREYFMQAHVLLHHGVELRETPLQCTESMELLTLDETILPLRAGCNGHFPLSSLLA
jgi:hypothetical protein